jgi:hypothetical protein
MNHSIDIDPSRAVAYFIRGTVYAEIGEQENAIADLEKSLELGLEPGDKSQAETLLEKLTR